MNPFVEGHDPAAPAIIDAATGETVSRGALQDAVGAAAQALRRVLGCGVVFHMSTNSVSAIVMYLGCLEAKCAVCLLESRNSHRMAALVDAFAPDAILLPRELDDVFGYDDAGPVAGGAYRILAAPNNSPRVVHQDLAVLLTTSGSTGSRKLVRLTMANLEANARSIGEYLGIEPSDRSVQTLPMHYSYGLSLINSHLIAGATVVLNPWSIVQREFWDAVDATKCTAFAGVPFIYETMHRLRMDPRRHPTLRTWTQAGGGLRPDLIGAFHDSARAASARFFVMYGQTEATARIAYVPSELLGAKLGSIGIPIPRGRLSIETFDDLPAGELVYDGPNVMMGYAESADDLASGDVQQGRLHTGDIAEVDEDGFYFLRGRLTRLAKLFGMRINLEDIEHQVERDFALSAAVIEHAGGLRIVAEQRESIDVGEMTRVVARSLRVPPGTIRVELVDAIPRTSSGKKDYPALAT